MLRCPLLSWLVPLMFGGRHHGASQRCGPMMADLETEPKGAALNLEREVRR